MKHPNKNYWNTTSYAPVPSDEEHMSSPGIPIRVELAFRMFLELYKTCQDGTDFDAEDHAKDAFRMTDVFLEVSDVL